MCIVALYVLTSSHVLRRCNSALGFSFHAQQRRNFASVCVIVPVPDFARRLGANERPISVRPGRRLCWRLLRYHRQPNRGRSFLPGREAGADRGIKAALSGRSRSVSGSRRTGHRCWDVCAGFASCDRSQCCLMKRIKRH